VTSTGDIDVVSQDAGTALLTHSTLHARLQADDHAAPGLAVLPRRADRRLLLPARVGPNAADHPWQLVGTFTSDPGGLVRVTRRPTPTVIYQAKVPASSSTYLAAASPHQTVRVS
jgi:hypothetical protein